MKQLDAAGVPLRAVRAVLLAGLVGAVLVNTVVPTRAQSAPARWVLEFGPYSGFYDFDAVTEFEDFAVFGLRLGARLSEWMRIEASFDEVYTSRKITDHRARQVSFNLHARIEPFATRVAPFALVGTGFVILDDADDPDAFGQAYDTGLGLRWNWRPRWLVRTEWVLRRQDFQLWRSVEEESGARSLESEAVTLWSRSLRLGLSHVF